MQFENDFVVPVPPARAWEVLLDMEQVARCMPGATLLGNDGNRFAGKVKVKVGPISVGYKGSAEFIEKDADNYRAVLKASGREERGAGTAGASVTAQLHTAENEQTRVHVVTDLDITGKPAQFGRGVMAEVGTAIIGQFAQRLAKQIEADSAVAANGSAVEQTAVTEAAPTTGTTEGAGAEVSPVSLPVAQSSHATPTLEDDVDGALDLGLLALKPAFKRLAPMAAGVLGLLVLVRVLTRQSKTPPVIVMFGPTPDHHWLERPGR